MTCLALFFAACLPSVADLSLEEKVGQLLITHFHGEEMNEEAKLLLEEIHIGGVIYYYWANGLSVPKQVQKLSNDLQNNSKIPLFIAIDQEGGKVSHLREGFTHFYGNGALGMTNEAVFAEQAAFAMGEEMAAVGINVNFAPVIDINSLHRTPLESRSYGTTPEVVVNFAERALHGFHQASLLTTLKHFPGLGNTTVDSHFKLPRIDRSIEELFKEELYPFKELIGMTDLIMTGHVLVPAFDPLHCATLSKIILQDVLRRDLGFKGLIISDSLIMDGLLEQVPSIEEATIQAFEAGCDLLLLAGKRLLKQNRSELTPKDIIKIHKALIDAVLSGRISQERLNDSVERILRVKETLSIQELTEQDIRDHVATDEHQKLSNRIYDRSLRCAKPAQ